MKVAVLLYTYAGNSFRGAERSMEVFNFVFPFLGLDIPSHVTIREWVLKAGLAELSREKKAIEDYAVIIDESITIAEHKVLMTLAVPARQGGHPLACSDAEVVDIHVASSHRSEDVKDAVVRVAAEAGCTPAYAVTDNGRNLVKGLDVAGIKGHRDISHSFGTYLKAAYGKDEEFVSLTKAIGNARHYALTDVDYLMPNNMRALARWMNMFDWARWAKDMIDAEHKLRPKERKMYAFLWKHGALIEELNKVMSCFREVLALCKGSGLSRMTVMEGIAVINRQLMGRGERLTRLGSMMIGYFTREAALLGRDEDGHNVSSDIIESLFGGFKERKSPNRMYGVTGFILVMPLETRLCTLQRAAELDFKAALERNRIADIKLWERKNLPGNLAAKRARVLRQAC